MTTALPQPDPREVAKDYLLRNHLTCIARNPVLGLKAPPIHEYDCLGRRWPPDGPQLKSPCCSQRPPVAEKNDDNMIILYVSTKVPPIQRAIVCVLSRKPRKPITSTKYEAKPSKPGQRATLLHLRTRRRRASNNPQHPKNILQHHRLRQMP